MRLVFIRSAATLVHVFGFKRTPQSLHLHPQSLQFACADITLAANFGMLVVNSMHRSFQLTFQSLIFIFLFIQKLFCLQQLDPLLFGPVLGNEQGQLCLRADILRCRFKRLKLASLLRL